MSLKNHNVSKSSQHYDKPNWKVKSDVPFCGPADLTILYQGRAAVDVGGLLQAGVRGEDVQLQFYYRFTRL